MSAKGLSKKKSKGKKPRVKNHVRGILIRDAKLLVIEFEDSQGRWFLLPGGKQRFGESLPQALRRETLEETQLKIQVGPLLFLRDYIGAHHEFAHEDKNVHSVEFSFLMDSKGNPQMGETPDEGQLGITWLPIDALHEYRLYPRALIEPLQNWYKTRKQSSLYLGDSN